MESVGVLVDTVGVLVDTVGVVVDTGGGTGDSWHALHAIITLDFVFCVI